MKQEKLLEILSDGEFHSGEELSDILSVSRTAIWKQVAKLESLGVEVHAVKGKGYRLRDDIDLLSVGKISVHLSELAQLTFNKIDLRLSAESTSLVVKESASTTPYVCLSEMQTAGRGRRGRTWVSPFAKNIYLSLSWVFSEATASLDSLSLCVAVVLARAVKTLGADNVGLKWPNDLLYEQKKLAGILLEASGELGGAIRVVIGVGLNVAMTRVEGKDIDQNWVALNQIISSPCSRNRVVAAMLNEFAVALPEFEQKGFRAFEKDWAARDLLINQQVDLHTGSQSFSGIARGVDDTGALLIEHNGRVTAYRGGEVSARVRL